MTTADNSPQIISYPQRTLAEWAPELASIEAQADIRAGAIKVYISGTIGIEHPGVTSEDACLLKGLPLANAGMGCIILDEALRQAQYDYAKCYNRFIVEHLKQCSLPSSNKGV